MSEAEERGTLLADGEYEPTLCRISSDLKVTVLSEPDVGAATASYIRPGNFFTAIARIVNQGRTYFELPEAAGYIPLHSRKHMSKIVVEHACTSWTDLNQVQITQHQYLCRLPHDKISLLLERIRQPGIGKHEFPSHAVLRLVKLTNCSDRSEGGDELSLTQQPAAELEDEPLERVPLYPPSVCSFCKGASCSFCIIPQQEGTPISVASGPQQECTQQ